jgi:hypothetical protein
VVRNNLFKSTEKTQKAYTDKQIDQYTQQDNPGRRGTTCCGWEDEIKIDFRKYQDKKQDPQNCGPSIGEIRFH